MAESTPPGVTLTITASGDVGQGKSRALEVVLAALKHSKIVKLGTVEHLEIGRAEIAVAQVLVNEPWKSKR